MADNLVIVESPAKAKTIEKFLGKDFHVVSSFGHVRDLPKKKLSIDIENSFSPQYVVTPDKKKVVSELKKLAKKSKMVWLASDEDREGEAIAWHLAQELKLSENNTKRIVFHEITKDAILNAIKNPRSINNHLVDAQQARRVLDRLVGYELSPVLWRKVKPSLSAGRVQSVAVKLLVEREVEIRGFKPEIFYKVVAQFLTESSDGKKVTLPAELSKKIKTYEEALSFVTDCQKAGFTIGNVEKKPSKRTPSAPFTTSTLQQEASRKLGFSVAQTMMIAQRLYENGYITYMRTDSVNLSQLALNMAEEVICQESGEKYHQRRNYTTKSKGAQEAHESIRPTDLKRKTVGGERNEDRLYNLIRQRTLASQMADAKLEKTVITINVSNSDYTFLAQGEVVLFDGFLKVYMESSDDEKADSGKQVLLPPMSVGSSLTVKSMEATQKFTHHPPRYTEASLVKKMEALGIGRPSTYAPTISTIQKRGYVLKEQREGTERKIKKVVLLDDTISELTEMERTGFEKNKLYPTDIGEMVTIFLDDNFSEIMNYQFTAQLEEGFDEIANGTKEWSKLIGHFYKDFHPKIEDTAENADFVNMEREIGIDPESKKKIIARVAKYGPVVQKGHRDDEEKPKYANIPSKYSIQTITLEQALDLFKLPRKLGEFEGEPMEANVGRFGPYIRYQKIFVSLPKDEDPYEVTLERAIELYKIKLEKSKPIKEFEKGEIQVLNGRYGPYIKYNKKNYKLPKELKAEPTKVTLADCKRIIKETKK